MEITHSTLKENVLQEFTKDYLEKHKELIEFVKNKTIKQCDMFSAEQMEESFNDGITCERQRCGYFDVENYL
jgi:hypothetical protein